jgi:hypothetical protein
MGLIVDQQHLLSFFTVQAKAVLPRATMRAGGSLELSMEEQEEEHTWPCRVTSGSAGMEGPH